MNAAIVYYSRTGNTRAAAALVEEGLRDAGVAGVRLMEVGAIDTAWLAQADVVVFGSPTYSASFAWPLKRWFDEEARNCGLHGKLAANFATGAHIGGGEDTALLAMAGHELVRGMLVYSGGGPLTHTGAVVIGQGDEAQRQRAVEFGRRVGAMALLLFCKKEKP